MGRRANFGALGMLATCTALMPPPLPPLAPLSLPILPSITSMPPLLPVLQLPDNAPSMQSVIDLPLVHSLTSGLQSVPLPPVSDFARDLAQVSLPEPSPLAFAVLAAVGFSVGSNSGFSSPAVPTLSSSASAFEDGRKNVYPSTNGRYNAADAERYFGARPALVLGRALRIAGLSAGFAAGLLGDRFLLAAGLIDADEVEAKSPERAAQLTALLTKLGPTFIKIGQSLSIRSDLLPPAYIAGLEQLQDKVPPFSTEEALRIMEEELCSAEAQKARAVTAASSARGGGGGGAVAPVVANRLEDVFVSLSAEPVAAASLGQVYRGRLTPAFAAKVRKQRRQLNNGGSVTVDGTVTSTAEEEEKEDQEGEEDKPFEVAVKVQRPDILESVALDMHLIRLIGPVLKNTLNLNTDIVGTVDDWGLGFVDELDYRREAANAERFTESIAKTTLAGAVFAPPVVNAASGQRVLTTEWVVGERLERSPAADVSALCSVAMNTYLTMLLDTGTLHCDPHPGNLLRTTDGRLCILDWGLVSEIRPDIQLCLIEHVAHLTSRDYAKVPADLVALGFVPEGKEAAIQETDAVEVLTSVYTQFAGGGGAAKIDVALVINELTGLSERYGNLFQLPPYFAYIARAFGVLEGIGLQNTPDYAIVAECLPYVSQRLLTDPSPRVGGALDSFVFGEERFNRNDRVLDADRIELIFSGLNSYTQSVASSTSLAKGEVTPGRSESLAFSPEASSSFASSSTVSSGSQTQHQLRQFTEQLLDLLLTPEPTPLQSLVFEQLAKITAASARKYWSDARSASGSMAQFARGDAFSSAQSGARSVLGSVVDPLGLFKGSALVEVDETDERALAAAAKLVELLNANEDLAAGAELSSEEVLRVVTEDVVPRLWEKRAEVVLSANRFVTLLLQQSARRLESPRRQVSSTAVHSNSPSPSSSSSRSPVPTEQPPLAQSPPASSFPATTANTTPSSRLQKARGLMNEATRL